VKAVRAACAAAEQTYRPSTISVPLTLFRASEKALRGIDSSQSGWQQYAAGGLEIQEVDGDHGNILNEPNVRKLASMLRARLEKAMDGRFDDVRSDLRVNSFTTT
jgi:thioesterase domain-containing protein